MQKEIRLLPAPAEQSPDAECIEKEQKALTGGRIKQMLRVLSYREREIIKLRFGLFGETEHTLEETCEIFHLKRERIRQIEAKALRGLGRICEEP